MPWDQACWHFPVFLKFYSSQRQKFWTSDGDNLDDSLCPDIATGHVLDVGCSLQARCDHLPLNGRIVARPQGQKALRNQYHHLYVRNMCVLSDHILFIPLGISAFFWTRTRTRKPLQHHSSIFIHSAKPSHQYVEGCLPTSLFRLTTIGSHFLHSLCHHNLFFCELQLWYYVRRSKILYLWSVFLFIFCINFLWLYCASDDITT